MLACYNKLPKEMQEAYAFINDYESLLQELMDALDAIRHIEHICKNESTFGIYKSKKSPNKLYGITPFALMIPLYPKVVNESVTKTFNFKRALSEC